MGYIKNHSIIINTFDKKKAKEAHKEAMKLMPLMTTELKETPINSDWSFAILPDGSKEGWADSDEYDIKRNMFIMWVQGQRYEDGSSPFKGVLVFFDEEDKIGIQNIS